MADDASVRDAAIDRPGRAQVIAYVEQMLVELAQMASDVGETALAASLALTSIQAGAARDRPAAG